MAALSRRKLVALAGALPASLTLAACAVGPGGESRPRPAEGPGEARLLGLRWRWPHRRHHLQDHRRGVPEAVPGDHHRVHLDPLRDHPGQDAGLLDLGHRAGHRDGLLARLPALHGQRILPRPLQGLRRAQGQAGGLLRDGPQGLPDRRQADGDAPGVGHQPLRDQPGPPEQRRGQAAARLRRDLDPGRPGAHAQAGGQVRGGRQAGPPRRRRRRHPLPLALELRRGLPQRRQDPGGDHHPGGARRRSGTPGCTPADRVFMRDGIDKRDGVAFNLGNIAISGNGIPNSLPDWNRFTFKVDVFQRPKVAASRVAGGRDQPHVHRRLPALQGQQVPRRHGGLPLLAPGRGGGQCGEAGGRQHPLLQEGGRDRLPHRLLPLRPQEVDRRRSLDQDRSRPRQVDPGPEQHLRQVQRAAPYRAGRPA